MQKDGLMKIIFASDFAPIRKFAPLMADHPEAVYGDLLPVLRAADLRIVNLESPLDPGDGFIVKSGAAFTGRPEHIASLKAGGFDIAVMANNHTFDCGEKGFSATRRLLRENGIAALGAGKDLAEARQPLILTADGAKIMLFAISEGEDMRGAGASSPGVRPWETEALAEEIAAARRSCDIVIVSAHCGLEYQPYPSFYVYEAFRKWAEAGADIIIGHHPHVPQGMAVFGKTPAYFSLGNFVFYQSVKFHYRKLGYLLELTGSATTDFVCSPGTKRRNSANCLPVFPLRYPIPVPPAVPGMPCWPATDLPDSGPNWKRFWTNCAPIRRTEPPCCGTACAACSISRSGATE